MSQPIEMELVVGSDGGVRYICGEALDMRPVRKLQITLASRGEPDAEGFEWAEMGDAGGPESRPPGRRWK